MKKQKAITLISLVITIIILIILASVAIYLSLGNNGIFTRTQQAKQITNKQTATEKMNLKITTAQMNKYADEQRMPTLKELSLSLKNDDEIEYVTEESQVASTKYKVGENPTTIFTKLNKYSYEFEINDKLQLASINGVKVANNESSEKINEETLKSMFYPNKSENLILSNNQVTIPKNGWLYIKFWKENVGYEYEANRNGQQIFYVACNYDHTGESTYLPVEKGDIITVTDSSYFTLELRSYEK